MMRGWTETDKGGTLWLVCPACDHRLAMIDPKRPNVLLWSHNWKREGDTLRWSRAKRAKLGYGPDPIGTYSHPGVTAAECPGRIVSDRPIGCGEAIDLT
jgi:hypothetical protein